MSTYIGLIFLLLAVAFLLRVDFIFYIIYVCVGVFAVSRWVPRRLMSNVRVTRDFPQRVFWGEPFTVTVTVENRGWLPVPWLQLNESTAVALSRGDGLDVVISMRSKQTTEMSYELLGKRRGYYRLGPLQVRTGDLFGMVPEQSGEIKADYVTVYPRIWPLHRLGLPAKLPFGTVVGKQRLFADPARPNGVRQFRSGDSMRQINWKVSARAQVLMVKTAEPAIALDTAIVLNMRRDDFTQRGRYTYIDWAVEIAASLAAHLANRGQAVGLLTNGRDPLPADRHGKAEETRNFDTDGRLLLSTASDTPTTADMLPIPPATGRAHLMRLLENLARVEAVPTERPLAGWLPEACHRLSWGTIVVVVTPTVNEDLSYALHGLVQRGLSPVAVVMGPVPGPEMQAFRRRGRRLAYTAVQVRESEQLQAWAGGRP